MRPTCAMYTYIHSRSALLSSSVTQVRSITSNFIHAMNVGYGMQCAWVTEDALLYGIDCICNNDLFMLHGIYIKIKSTEKKNKKKKKNVGFEHSTPI